MKLSKKLISVFLVFMFVFSLTACSSDQGVVQPEAPAASESQSTAADAQAPSAAASAPAANEEAPSGGRAAYIPPPVEELQEMTQEEVLALQPDPEPSGTITIGSSTIANPDFVWGFTNITTNAVAKELMTYGLRLIDRTREEQFYFNPVLVKEWEAVDNADGTKTYTFEIYDNHVFSDGTPIMAKHFVYTYLFMSSQEFQNIDGNATHGQKFVGWDEFNTKQSPSFSGIRLLGDYEMSFTIKAEELPYFYDMTFFINSYPLPIHVITPNADVVDNGGGAEITGEFNGDVLNETFLKADVGYRYAPSVVAGAYKFVSFDVTDATAIIEINPLFKCYPDGAKASVERIIFKATQTATQMNELDVGTVDIIGNLSTPEHIEQGLDMVDAGKLMEVNYPNNGYGKVVFHCDFGPTQFKAVRQAICYLLDREEFGRQTFGGYSMVIDARYSLSEWTYQAAKDEIDAKAVKYTLNTDKANELLDADGWTLNETGGEYVPGPDAIRYKMVGGELMPLIIEWCSSEGVAVTESLQVMLPPAAAEVGMKINQSVYESVLDFQYRRNVDVPFFHMFNLSTNFGVSQTPWVNYELDQRFWGATGNNNYIHSEALYNATQAMKKTPPGDNEQFLQHWVEYTLAWNDEVPDIPLYTAIRYDFYNPRIKGFESGSSWQLGSVIPRVWVEE